jgi:hypothetical protein
MPNVLFLLIAGALLLRSGLSRATPRTPAS